MKEEEGQHTNKRTWNGLLACCPRPPKPVGAPGGFSCYDVGVEIRICMIPVVRAYRTAQLSLPGGLYKTLRYLEGLVPDSNACT